MIKKEAEETLKKLTIEKQRMWNIKRKVTAVIIGAKGIISKAFRKYLSSLPRKREVKELKTQSYCALRTYFGKC